MKLSDQEHKLLEALEKYQKYRKLTPGEYLKLKFLRFKKYGLNFPKPYPVFNYEEKKITVTTGKFIVMREDHKNILNPETLTGDLLWFTTEGGYDYNHPKSRAEERALLIVEAFNKTQDQLALEAALPEMYALLIQLKEALSDKEDLSIHEESVLDGILKIFKTIPDGLL